METNSYVVGFMFNPKKTRVALIRKAKPAWQRGKLNGIGGSIEPGESATAAMTREFKEESGCDTTESVWTYFSEMAGGNDDGNSFRVYFFFAVGDISCLRNMTPEKIECVDLCELHVLRRDVIENLPWLVALAYDCLTDGRPCFTRVIYPAHEKGAA